MRGLPLAPPPDELVSRALEVAATAGLQVEFTTRINDEGILVWCVQIATERGTLIGTPNGNTEQAWIDVLHDLGLLVGG